MQQKGFTLVEVMIVVIVIAIIAAITYPNYIDFVHKGNRKEGMIALTRMASLQEKFFLDRKTFSSSVGNDFNLTDCTSDTPGLGYDPDLDSSTNLSENGYYTLTITGAAPVFAGSTCTMTNPATSFTLTATATSKGKQNEDTEQGADCSILTLNHNGVKTPVICW